ncbi:hypothetical protein BJ508DRAFT_416536 [Ascobolus immersus RN42]|uniref:BTB domain-containing protein n=1 Tax=Ascobolus immersus RN42 TaxID=1160509 RepID=A0A3N4HX46_ASCIM|nr:hypothetical protein BJ508DRAFT_416536 [Ascobolus immersus RN42]
MATKWQEIDLSVCRHFAKTFQSPMIQVIVGKPPSENDDKAKNFIPQRSYGLHIDKLEAASEYFKGLFSFNGKEMETKEIRLEDGFENSLDFDAFDAFVQFLYTGSFDGPEAGDRTSNDGDAHAVLAAYVWALADRLIANGLKAEALSKLRKRYDGHEAGRISTPNIAHIVQKLYGSSLRPYSPQQINEDGSNSVLCCSSACINHIASSVADKQGYCDGCWEAQNHIDGGYRNSTVRSITASYVGSRLSKYRDDPRFRELLRDYGEFSEDLVMSSLSSMSRSTMVSLHD